MFEIMKGTKVDKSKRKKIGRRKLLGISGGGSEDKKEKLFLFGRPIISLEIGRRRRDACDRATVTDEPTRPV